MLRRSARRDSVGRTHRRASHRLPIGRLFEDATGGNSTMLRALSSLVVLHAVLSAVDGALRKQEARRDEEEDEQKEKRTMRRG